MKRIRRKHAFFCLGNDKNNVFANKVLTYVYAPSLKYTPHISELMITVNFLSANADLLKISLYIFFHKTYRSPIA